ncbi:MAG: ABC transporter permease [Cellvibrionaceae bacterium]
MSTPVLSEAINQAVTIIFSNDAFLWEIIFLSFRVSLSALACSLLIGIPVAILMTVYPFSGKKIIHIIIDTMMALPPVVVGLIVYLLLSRSGPLGIWGLLYTPTAMIIAQTLLITPIVIALSLQLFHGHWERLQEQLYMLGFKPHHCFRILIRESKAGLITVVLAAFGRAIAEIGAVMIVGGNIEHHTRVMTTAIAMETRQGNLSLALALGIILILLALFINAAVHLTSRYSGKFAP